MSHAYAAALCPSARERRAHLQREASRFWEEAPLVLARDGGEGLGSRLRELDPRLGLARVGGRLRIRPLELAAWPVAELAVDAAEGRVPVETGLPPGPHLQALAVAEGRTGISLEDSRVRVGLTRGHLIAIVVEIPLDIVASEEQLQLASETYVEVCLGDDASDRWVVSIDVVRAGRRQSLLRVADSRKLAESFPIEETKSLVARAISAIEAERTPSWLNESASLWTALAMDPVESAMQGDRCHASTICPEALKAALEGLPFDSRRFSQADELLVWVGFSPPPNRRAALRDRAEQIIARASGACLLAGSGFGEHTDYLDLWVTSEPSRFARAIESLAAGLELSVKVGFYDSRLRDETVLVPPGPC